MDIDQLNSDPSDIAIADNPRNNILPLEGRGVNSVILNGIEYNLREAQRMTRFSDVMTGQPMAASTTATAVASAMNQGSVGIKDKRSDIARAMQEADIYCLKLCLSKWDKSFWTTVRQTGSEYIDIEMLRKVPKIVPISSKRINELRTDKPDIKPEDIPKWEVLYEHGEIVTTELDYDVEVRIAAGLPKGKTESFNELMTLAQLMLFEEDGTQRPAMDTSLFIKKMEDITGIQLRDKTKKPVQQPAPAQQPSMLNPISEGGPVQAPQGSSVKAQPPNLMGTMAGLPGMDQRGKMGV